MILDQLGQELHDKQTRGTTLTSQEQSQLQEWYQQQDAAEEQSISQGNDLARLSELRVHLNQALEQVKTTAQGIQDLSAENDALRRETASLRERLSQRATPKAA